MFVINNEYQNFRFFVEVLFLTTGNIILVTKNILFCVFNNFNFIETSQLQRIVNTANLRSKG